VAYNLRLQISKTKQWECT